MPLKYTYTITAQGEKHSPTYYAHIQFDRSLAQGGVYYHSHDTGSPAVKALLADLAATKNVDGTLVRIEGSQLQVAINPFRPGETVKYLVKKIMRRLAPGDSVQRVPQALLDAQIAKVNLFNELEAVDVMVEAAKILPNSDPIRLAAAIEDLNLPPAEALAVLRKLAPQFKGDNSDPIRLVSGYLKVLALVKK